MDGFPDCGCCRAEKELPVELVQAGADEETGRPYRSPPSRPVLDALAVPDAPTRGPNTKDSTVTATQTLSVNLQDLSLLRATTLPHVLSRAGSHFGLQSLVTSSYTESQAKGLYGKSKKVHKIGYFISHCWRDGRWGKLAALLIHSNLKAAMALSTVVALLCGLLARMEVLPRVETKWSTPFPWALYFGTATFFLVLTTFHNLKALFIERTYFLDKFCVHQTDMDLKEKGVNSFAAFVTASDRMMVLWSQQYFTRLWCTLEVAALVKSSNGQAQARLPMDFAPLHLAKVYVTLWVVYAIVMVVVQTNRILGSPVPHIYFVFVLMVLCSYLLVTTSRPYARSRQDLERQLRSFSVQEAECFCPADRRRVEKSLLRWFADLDMFNKHVREGVADLVVRSLGRPAHLPTEMLLPTLLLGLFSEADHVAGHYFEKDTLWRVASHVGWHACVLANVPLAYRLCYCFREQRSTRFREVLTNMLLTVLVSSMWVVGFLVNFAIADSSVNFTTIDPIALSGWVYLLPAAEWLLFFVLQRDSFSQRCSA